MSYISPEQQNDWAVELLSGVGDSTSSTLSVVLWLRSNLGLLNQSLSTDFQISGDNYIVPEFTNIQSGIYNEFFICNWLRKKSIKTLGAMEFDWIEMEGEDQGKIKRVSHTQKAAVYQNMAKDCDVFIKDLIKTYRGGDFARPRQITFNGRESSRYASSIDCFSWSEFNPITNF